jgi:hypothetical protein
MKNRFSSWLMATCIPVLLGGCVPNGTTQSTDNNIKPFVSGSSWLMKWTPQNSNEHFQLKFSIVKASRKSTSDVYYLLDTKSDRPEYSNVSSDGFISYNSGGAGTTYLFFLASQNTTKRINCGFKDIKKEQITVKGVSYLTEPNSNEDINPIYYFSLYKGDYSKVGECSLEKL